jgi:hypothetical protein
MPDWTYHPLSPIATTLLGQRRTQILAMRLLAAVVMFAAGRHWIPWVFDHPAVPAQWEGRFGASVPVSVARESIAVLPVQGATFIEVGPVGIDDVDTPCVGPAPTGDVGSLRSWKPSLPPKSLRRMSIQFPWVPRLK